MKIKTLISAVMFGIYMTANAQWPASLSFNTADDGTGALVGVGNADLNWRCATSLGGVYNLIPEQVSPATGWHNGSGNPVFPSNAQWISYPHTCTSDPKEDYCGCTTYDPCRDDYYQVAFTLTNAGNYVLNLTMMADNCIVGVYLNNTQVYTAPSIQLAAGSPYYGGYLFLGHQAGNEVTLNLTSGFIVGSNTLKVHVRSGINSTGQGWTGLVVTHTKCYTDYNSCESGGGGSGGSEDCCLGNKCSDPENPLFDNYQVPLAGYHFLFTGDGEEGGNIGKVGVGYGCSDQMPAKLNATTSKRTYGDGGLYPESIGIYGSSLYSGIDETSVGVYGEAKNMESQSISVGVWGDALGSHDNVGGRFYAEGGQNYNIGVSAIAFPSTGNPAPHTYQQPIYYPTGANIGIYAAGEPINSQPGPAGMDWAGWFDGDVFINGQGYYANMAPIASDQRFKREIKPIAEATGIIALLKPSNYMMKTDNEYGMHFSDKKQFGFISQEVEKVVPDLVHDVMKPTVKDDKGNVIAKEIEYKALNYIGFIALLTKGIQEQQAMIESQQTQINELKAAMHALSGIPASNQTGLSTSVMELSDKNMLVLNQNVPNPFAESTVISYNIPERFGKAQLVFTTNEGSLIKTYDILKEGHGSITVFANDLSNGIYSYSLIIDGRTVETKKMIKQ